MSDKRIMKERERGERIESGMSVAANTRGKAECDYRLREREKEKLG